MEPRLYYASSMGMTEQFFVFFLSLVTLTFDLWIWHMNSCEIFCTMYLTAKFDCPTFSRSEVVVWTNKQTNPLTNWQTNRRCWKHPPRSAVLRRWVNIISTTPSSSVLFWQFDGEDDDSNNDGDDDKQNDEQTAFLLPRTDLQQVIKQVSKCITTPPPHHNRFTALFPGPPGLAGDRRELLDFTVQGED